MENHFETLARRLEELNQLMADPAVLSDPDRYRRLAIEQADLLPVVTCYHDWEEVKEQIEEHKELLYETDDYDFRELVRVELAKLEEKREALEQQLQEAILPHDPNDRRNVIVEIRAGAGGDEAALFAAVLYHMYSQYAERHGWSVQFVDAHETEIGGFKEIIFMVEGKNAYSHLRFESGVHRVQRVPVTEAGGRIHTSTVTVAVLPEAEDVEVDIDPADLEIDTFRASGAGGQHVNRTDSAIRITHKPSGIVVTCQDQRSQYKNKDRAMAVLKARLLEQERMQQEGNIARNRRNQIGTGDRSERIRTYNYPQGRVTDHRIGLTLYQLDEVLEGNLDPFIKALMAAEKSRQSQAHIKEDD